MPTIHCINLDRDKDRWAHAEKQARLYWKGKIERFSGIETDFGCRMSHIALIEKAFNEKMPYILIAEDDFVLVDEKDTVKKFKEIMKELPDNWYCVKFGTASPGWESIGWKRSSANLVQNAVKGCFFYMLSAEAIADCVSRKEEADDTMDNFLSGKIMTDKNAKRCFLAAPMIAHVSDRFESTRTEKGPHPNGKAYRHNCEQIDSFIHTFYWVPKTPWAINDMAMEELKKMITNRKNKVVEFGSGWGTTQFREWGAKVLSYEQNDAYWMPSCNGSEIAIAPIKEGWYDKNIVDNSFERYYDYWRQIDVLIIDGPYAGKGKTASRFGVLDFIGRNIERFRTAKTWFVVDDTNRPKDYAIIEEMKTRWSFSEEFVKGDGIRTTHFLRIE